MPVVWPTLLDLSRDECKRILRKLELEAYAGVISALRAQGDLTKEKKDLLGELSKVLSISTERHRAEVRRAVNDERLTTIAHKMNLSLYLGERPSYSMSGPNSSSEWSIEGRRLVPLMPRLVPQTAFTVTANAVANAAIQHNASLPVPAETGSKEGVSCSDEDEKPRKRRRTNSSSSSPVVLKEVPKAVVPVSKTITVPVSGSPKMSNIMQSIANSLPPHMSPVKITFTKPSTQTTNTTTQKVIIVTTSPSSTFVPNILSKSHNYAAVTKLVPTSVIASTTQKPPVVITASQSSLVSNSSSGSSSSTPSPIPNTVAVTAVVSSTPSVVMSTVAQGVSTSAIKMASTRLPSPKSLVSAPTQILAQFPKQHQQSPKQQLYQVQQQTQQQVAQPSPVSHQQQPQQSPLPPGIKPTIQIKQESGVKIITQQVQPSKILPKPVTATLPTSSNSPIMVVSSNGAIMTTKLVTTPTGTQATYTRPTVSPSIGRMAATPGAATYVKTTSGSIITVVPKSLATLGGKIISSNIVSGTTTKITTIPMTSKPNVIVVQKTTGKGTTIQGLPGKNVVTTLLNAGGEKTIQTVPTGAKPAILTATRPITKMIVTQPKGIGSTVQPAAKIIPTKIVYGQQGKTQVLIKPKPVTFQATVVSEQTRQLVTETLQQASRVAEAGNSSIQEGKEEPQNYTDSSSSSTESSQSSQDSQPVVHVIASRRQDWSEHEIAMETSPTIIYQDVSSESQSATSTIKALLELQQTTVKEKLESKPRQPTIDLSQMAVPIQMTQEKRHSPESPSIAVVESELVAEYITTVSHRSQPQQPSQPQRTLLQHVAQSQTATQTSVVVKSIPASSPGAITHIMQQALSSHTAFTKHSEELGTEEGEVEEMDTLDPQTGLFYRSALTQSQSAKQQKLSQPPLEQTQLQVKTLQCFQTKQKQTIHLQADQLQHKLPQMPQLSIRHQKLTPLQQEQAQPKPDVQHTQHPMVAKDRQLPTLMAQPPQTVVQVLAVKTTQQLPKLQQAPNQPKIYVQPQTPQSQMSLPASSEKQTASQVEQPIITQGSSVTKITFEGRQPPTVTKITGGSSVPKLTSPVTSISPIQASEKTAVSDILKMSLMEAQIDTNVEHMIVDPPKKALATSMLTGEAGSLPSTHMVVAGMANSTPQQQKCRESCSSPSTVGSSLTTRKIDPPAVPATGQFMRIQNVGQKKAEESPAEIIIQAIPQYAIPCHSSSNVVVEPSGLLELNNFTSQQLDDEETAMEQDIDSSTEDGTEPSPSQSSAERS
ncbi:BRCA2-interacting transcriptional repressor EMSY isoform X11 [Nomascus leucogenys]|uniref:BRCA2-interacting transcriptional repressor EMSY isoform X14 n=1 Tax=Homo sapiens TaxID=9606 RepID=UPI000387CA93|nr:BRCA2-interacting transcriptional repressor EMSY isoform X14 [Homo sapiens]XP_016777142.1 BRCA2-interacting transcriptional repressor EMSY isoform X18 [Pan troglodytes]XP_030685058.1 BRCA2-interacting transcriptional repressor EMSY isoform X11 [Nomascus leucogenys]XP_034789300.1 BRCA2-interacting transcriptional repressor EMSY isoform X11 [Pan paniscus]XP_054225375.1 BRCA2-interacting transcriptional repressor EMSY isoform X14 [Homo sapiens]XP_055138972.1 BRCA2-interacting transcriptional r|eukprot:XP_005274169.1 BRCA2-interacting transcriptional repressor EMSY isoform X8 [Homo sapiens]